MYGDTEVMRKHAGRLREQGVDIRSLADQLVAQAEARQLDRAAPPTRCASGSASAPPGCATLPPSTTAPPRPSRATCSSSTSSRTRSPTPSAGRACSTSTPRLRAAHRATRTGSRSTCPARPGRRGDHRPGHAAAPPHGLLESLPRRISLTLPELRLVAECAGGAPLPFDGDPRADAAFGGRLGRSPGAPEQRRTPRRSPACTNRTSLARRGLLVDTGADESLLGAVGLLATPTLALDLDVGAAGSGEGLAPAPGRRGRRPRDHDGLVFELAWFPTGPWADELSRVAVLPEDHPVRESALPERVDLPYELADAAVEAVRTNRPDLLPVLVGSPGARHRRLRSPLPDVEVVSAAHRARHRAERPAPGAGRRRVGRETTTVVGVVVGAARGRLASPAPHHDVDGLRIEVARVEPGGPGRRAGARAGGGDRERDRSRRTTSTATCCCSPPCSTAPGTRCATVPGSASRCCATRR